MEELQSQSYFLLYFNRNFHFHIAMPGRVLMAFYQYLAQYISRHFVSACMHIFNSRSYLTRRQRPFFSHIDDGMKIKGFRSSFHFPGNGRFQKVKNFPMLYFADAILSWKDARYGFPSTPDFIGATHTRRSAYHI